MTIPLMKDSYGSHRVLGAPQPFQQIRGLMSIFEYDPSDIGWLVERQTLKLREHEMALAILKDALRCYYKGIIRRDGIKRLDFRDAKAWIWPNKEDEDGLYSFASCCEYLGISPSGFRRGLVRFREKHMRERRFARASRKDLVSAKICGKGQPRRIWPVVRKQLQPFPRIKFAASIASGIRIWEVGKGGPDSPNTHALLAIAYLLRECYVLSADQITAEIGIEDPQYTEKLIRDAKELYEENLSFRAIVTDTATISSLLMH